MAIVEPKKPFELIETDKPFLAELPARVAVLLKLFADGNGYEAIALAQGIPVGTVKSRIHRARERILNNRAKVAAAAETMQEPTMQGVR